MKGFNRSKQKFSLWISGHGAETFSSDDLFGYGLSMPLLKLRLVVKQVHMGRSTVLKQLDDPFGLGGKMRQVCQTGLGQRRRVLC